MPAKKQIHGVVVSDKMQKGVIVAVDRQTRHGLYGKTQRRRTKFMAHDEEDMAKIGDHVVIVEGRPQSRRKRWVVTSVIQRAR